MSFIELPEHRKRVQAWREWLPQRWNFNVFGTLHFNQSDVTLTYGRKRLFRFLTDVQKKGVLFGRKFYELPWEERIDGVIVPEKIDCNIHYHFLFQMPSSKIQHFYSEGARVWKTVHEPGKFWSREQSDPAQWEKIISYATKEQHKDLNYQNLILVRECWV